MLLATFPVKGVETPPPKPKDRFHQARDLFTESAEDESKLEAAIRLFTVVLNTEPELAGRAQTYLGALEVLKAKYTRWPHKKWRHIRRGLSLMDKGVEMNPEDVESLFVHGVACHHAPRLFRRQDDAQRDFQRILQRLPTAMGQYDRQLVVNILDYLEEDAELEAVDRARVQQLRDRFEEPDAP
jgi:hypothetical protein